MNSFARVTILFGALISGLAAITAASWCPFCTAVQQTLSEQMGTSDIVVLAELVELPTEAPKDDQLPKGLFRVTEVIKGQPDVIAPSHEFKSIVIGQPQLGQSFLLMGVDPPEIAWTTPLKMSLAAVEYLRAVPKLPAKGAERLKFFQRYFEHAESMLAFDAYEEFARASYAEVIDLKPFMERDKLLQWIQNPDVSTNRKRLYFTLLGVCGTPEDLPLLESLITSEVNENRRGLDAIVACYLTLKGDSGLDLIERQFFENPRSEYVDTFAAISAIRFLATEKKEISRERILAALHKVLDRPTLADLVIPDLARWEDWTVIDKMVELFKNSNEDTKWVRVPVVSYLQVCPKPEAKAAIEQLKLIDPESVRRAETLLKWESGEDEFEDSDSAADADVKPADANAPNIDIAEESETPVDSQAKPTDAAAPSKTKPDSDGSKKSGGGTAPDAPSQDSINVPVYEVKRLPTDPSEVPTIDRLIDSPAQGQYVSTTAAQPFNPPLEAGEGPPQVEPALVASAPTFRSTIAMIFVPLGSFMVLLVLLWSVLNGWFERLIF